MNERIKELAEQAGFHFDEYNKVTQRKVELLTELLVRECAEIAFKSGRVPNKGEAAIIEANRIYYKIHEYFGAEE